MDDEWRFGPLKNLLGANLGQLGTHLHQLEPNLHQIGANFGQLGTNLALTCVILVQNATHET